MSRVIENPYENFIALSRYARWIPDENRREKWGETVDRYFNFMLNHLLEKFNYTPDKKLVDELKEAVYSRNVMPSMRAVMTSGPALDRDHVAGYNCSFVPVDSPRSFDETMYILMCGTGVGFSVEYKYVNKLPAVPESFEKSTTVIVVEDSKTGWAKAYRELLAMLWAGQIPAIDVSKLRPAGARLKTMGGRSSGPQPLINLFDFTIAKFKGAAGRQLKPIEAHDIMCKIGEVVVVGGVRRSAMISLSNINDIEMAAAKSGNWWENNTQRALSNNSVAYSRKPEMEQFIAEWKNLYDSKSGERGIYNVAAAQKQAARWGRRDPEIHYGTNPCSEIILRPYQFCNLSEVVIRENDSLKDIENKVKLATVLGTWQSTLTDFKYLRKIWKDNTEEERLLGVSLTGQFGHKFMSGKEDLTKLGKFLEDIRDVARFINKAEADRIGINESAAITCVKPSGTVSQLVGVSSGMHAWHSEYYIEVTKEEYEDLLSKMPNTIRWEDLSFYETEDGTSGTQTLACTSDGNCEIVDISA